jgi:hypothetical protein
LRSVSCSIPKLLGVFKAIIVEQLKNTETNPTPEAPRKALPPEAQRALAEAEERRRLAAPKEAPKEINGRDGPEPVRYGDWEVKGIASDF